MKNKNILLAIFIIIVSIGGILIYNLIPQFETTEFNQNSIVKISEGSTTTLESTETPTTTIGDSEDSEMIDIQSSEIEILLKNNSTKNISEEFVTYLLVGSDRRNENSSLSRGFVEGQRADVIILTIINKENDSVSLVSLPRDLLIKNSCTEEIQRINSTFQKNDCGNSAENLSANILNVTGLLVDHFALFTFEGFEKIIDSLGGVEVCIERAQKEGYSFELKAYHLTATHLVLDILDIQHELGVVIYPHFCNLRFGFCKVMLSIQILWYGNLKTFLNYVLVVPALLSM